MKGRWFALLPSALARLVVFAASWWVLTEGDLRSPYLAAAAIVAATAASLAFTPPSTARWRVAGALPFAIFFLRESVVAGVDVMRRALDPSLPIDPAIVRHRFTAPPGPGRTLVIAVTSLLPGTLSVDVVGDELLVHVLDGNATNSSRALQRIEDRVAALVSHPDE